jgi:hypothetical protein
MRAQIVPEPPEPEREAILAALASSSAEQPQEAWAEAARAEAVDASEVEP